MNPGNRMSLIVTTTIAVLSLAACAALTLKDTPSIAHVHIGHAITGLKGAPKNRGLLVAAEQFSVSASNNSEQLLQAVNDGDIKQSKKYLKKIAKDVDPSYFDNKSRKYGLRRATAEATTHLALAGKVNDATDNVRRTVLETNTKAQEIIDRIDELTGYIEAGLQADNIPELEIISEEINLLMKTIAGDSEQTSYGLHNFRADIEAMVAREDPDYETVDRYYLFSLIKLPGGEWGFKFPQPFEQQDFEDSDNSY